jgi:hypothetical protein
MARPLGVAHGDRRVVCEGRRGAAADAPERLGDAGAIGRRIAARDDEDVEAPEAAEGLPKAAAGQQLGS